MNVLSIVGLILAMFLLVFLAMKGIHVLAIGLICSSILAITSGMNIYVSMIIAFLAGCIAGLATGIFHTVFGIPAILSGILTQLALYSINLRILGNKANQSINVMNYDLIVSLRNITQSIIVGLVIVFIFIAILYWFFGTELGHSIRATGNNQAMARANGINTNVNKIIGLVLSNGIVALSGALLAQYQGFADVNMGRGAIVIGLAAVIIGEVIFGKLFKNFRASFGCVRDWRRDLLCCDHFCTSSRS